MWADLQKTRTKSEVKYTDSLDRQKKQANETSRQTITSTSKGTAARRAWRREVLHQEPRKATALPLLLTAGEFESKGDLSRHLPPPPLPKYRWEREHLQLFILLHASFRSWVRSQVRATAARRAATLAASLLGTFEVALCSLPSGSFHQSGQDCCFVERRVSFRLQIIIIWPGN